MMCKKCVKHFCVFTLCRWDIVPRMALVCHRLENEVAFKTPLDAKDAFVHKRRPGGSWAIAALSFERQCCTNDACCTTRPMQAMQYDWLHTKNVTWVDLI